MPRRAPVFSVTDIPATTDIDGQFTGSATEGTHRTTNEIERESIGVEIHRLTKFANTKHLGSPTIHIFHINQACIHVQVGASPRKCLIHLLKGLLAHLVLVRSTYLFAFSAK